MANQQTTFSGEYIFSVICGLTSVYIVEKNAPRTHPIIKYFVIPLFITYLILLFLNTVTPTLNESTTKFKNYVSNKGSNSVNSLGYVQIFPPLFAILVIFIILLYNHNFDQKKNNSNSRNK
jgi:uncharacterized BrkB/YihY/UPF0761 family membrane protein